MTFGIGLLIAYFGIVITLSAIVWFTRDGGEG